MSERKFLPNIVCIFLILLICLTIWQIAIGPVIYSFNFRICSNPTYVLYPTNSSGYVYPLDLLPPNDYNRLIDLNFTFDLLNPICTNDTAQSLLLLVIVHSSPYNFAKRQTLRETWGRPSDSVRMVFFLGRTVDGSIKQRLDKENSEHGDLVRGSFLDTYKNITYKHVMALKFTVYHCPHAKYILKTDDDVFVNMPALINFLNVDLSPFGGSRMLFCTPRRHIIAERTYRSKWRVSFKEYPQRNYPTYCPGWVLLYSPDVVFNLYKEAQHSDYFWIDDIHITGVLAERIRITHGDIEPLVITKPNFRTVIDYSSDISQPFLFGRPDMSTAQIRLMWNYTKTRKIPTSLIKYMVF